MEEADLIRIFPVGTQTSVIRKEGNLKSSCTLREEGEGGSPPGPRKGMVRMTISKVSKGILYYSL